MVQNAPFNLQDIPEINPVYMMQYEESQKAWVLLYPEGIIKLNDAAANILKLCTGDKNLEVIIAELKEMFNGADLEDDVYSFMEMALDKSWIRTRPS